MGKIKDLPLMMRPREKAKYYGLTYLSEIELLALIIGNGTKDKSSIDLALEMINGFGGFNNIFNSNVYELSKYKGISEAKALSILAIKEIFIRVFKNEIKDGNVRFTLSCSLDVYNYTHIVFDALPYEKIIVFYLNTKNEVLYEDHFSNGANDLCYLDNKIVCKTAIEKYAKKIIICHNHPSGNTSPSLDDINMFFSLQKALANINIKLIDHIIIGQNEYYSVKDEKKTLVI